MIGQIRQGDILLIPVTGIIPPDHARISQEVILATGETTGHAHRVQAPTILEWSVDEQRYIQVQGNQMGTITHEDHDPIPAPVVAPNVTYQVVQQREWDITSQWRRVQD